MIALALLVSLSLGSQAECRTACESMGLTQAWHESGVSSKGLSSDLDAVVGLDKLLHASISANVVIGTTALLSFTRWPMWQRVLAGVVSAVSLGLLKETVDLLQTGRWDWGDLAADGVGVLAGAGVFYVGRF
jgi:uncharacterized protein YfiM (DUF2279 family)